MIDTASSAKGLRIHAFVFVIVVLANIIINVMTGPPWWFQWVLLGWGVALAAHWFFTRSTKPV